MARARDEDFAPDERLYRGLKTSWVHNDQVLAAGIDLPQSSVGRSKYGGPELVKTAKNPAVGVAINRDLPHGINWQDAGGWPLTFAVVDDPDEGDHHAHLRVHPVTGPFDETKKPNGSQARQIMREDIADAFRVLIPPA